MFLSMADYSLSSIQGKSPENHSCIQSRNSLTQKTEQMLFSYKSMWRTYTNHLCLCMCFVVLISWKLCVYPFIMPTRKHKQIQRGSWITCLALINMALLHNSIKWMVLRSCPKVVQLKTGSRHSIPVRSYVYIYETHCRYLTLIQALTEISQIYHED